MFKIEAGISNITIVDFPSIIEHLKQNAREEAEKAIKPKDANEK